MSFSRQNKGNHLCFTNISPHGQRGRLNLTKKKIHVLRVPRNYIVRTKASIAISTAATTTVTCTTTQPAVINGRPNTRPFSWPTVGSPRSRATCSLCLSAKSCTEWRARTNERRKRRPPSNAKRRPTVGWRYY